MTEGLRIAVTPASDEESDALCESESDMSVRSFEVASDCGPDPPAKLRTRVRSISFSVHPVDVGGSGSGGGSGLTPARSGRRKSLSQMEMNRSGSAHGRRGSFGRVTLRRGSAASSNNSDEDEVFGAQQSLASSIALFQEMRARMMSGGCEPPPPPFSIGDLVEKMRAREVVEFENDWKMLVTPSSGTIWVNAKTGQFRQYPPNYVVKKQQDQLIQSEKEREELEDQVASLKSTLAQYEADVKRKEVLEEEYKDLQLKYDEATAQMQRGNRNTDKIRAELKEKADKCIMYEKEMHMYLQRISKFEERMKEVNTLDETVTELKEKVQSLEASMRDKDFEVLQSTRKMNEAQKKLEDANETIANLELKYDEMRYQVRLEVERNAKIGRDLMEMNWIKDENEKMKAAMAKTLAEADRNSKLLNAARRTIREYRDRIKALEVTEAEFHKVEEELKVSHYETSTLKKLMAGKDSLVVQKTQALDLARQLIDHLKAKDEQIGIEVERLLERVDFVPTYPFGSEKGERKIEIRSMTPTTEISGISMHSVNGGTADHELTKSSSSNSTSTSLKASFRTQTTTAREMLSPKCRTSTTSNSESSLTHSNACLPVFPPTAHHTSTPSLRPASPHPYDQSTASRVPVTRPQTAVVRPQPKMHCPPFWGEPEHCSDSGSSVRNDLRLVKLAAKYSIGRQDVDRLASLFIHMGDRVHVQSDGALKPATVKYVGPLNKHPHDRKVYVGVKMDEAIGDCDGCYNGKRFFTVPHNRGLIVRASDVQAVYNVKCNKFKPLDESVEEYMRHRKRG